MDPTPLICRACGARPESATEGDRCLNGDSFLIRADISRRHARDFFLGHALEGDYVLLDVLGKGGFGTVYRALDRNLGRPVAVKVLHANLAQNDSVRARFDREARAIASLRHPTVVDVYRFGERRPTRPGEPHILYMVLEYIDGRTLKDMLRERGRISPMEVVRIALPVLQALAEAHDQGIVHRDLKPANIMVAPGSGRPEVRMLDFGIAKVLDDDTENPLTGVGMLLGTAKYMPPEQIRNDGVGPTADLYALGVILYEMLAGKPPFVEESGRAYLLAHIGKAVPRIPPEAGVSPDLELVVRTALSKLPAERYRTARDMLAALLAAVPGAEMLSGQYLFGARGVSPPFSAPIPAHSGVHEITLSETSTTPEPSASGQPDGSGRAADPPIEAPALEVVDAPRPLWLRLAAGLVLVAAVALFVWWPDTTVRVPPRKDASIAVETFTDPVAIPDAGPYGVNPRDAQAVDARPHIIVPAVDAGPPDARPRQRPARGKNRMKRHRETLAAPEKPAPDPSAPATSPRGTVDRLWP